MGASACGSLGSIYCLGNTRGFGAGGEGLGCVPDDLNLLCLQEYRQSLPSVAASVPCASVSLFPFPGSAGRSLCLFL